MLLFANSWCATYHVAYVDSLPQWVGKQIPGSSLLPAAPCSPGVPGHGGLGEQGSGAADHPTACEWQQYRNLWEKNKQTVLVRSPGFHNEIRRAFKKRDSKWWFSWRKQYSQHWEGYGLDACYCPPLFSVLYYVTSVYYRGHHPVRKLRSGELPSLKM